MKILLTGGTGQVGFELAKRLPELGEVFAPDRSALDLSDIDAVRDAVRRIRPDIIVNPAAYTAVDKAETEADLAMRINADAPRAMAEEAQKLGALMIHYSTDYVFDGTREGAYLEDDEPNPQSVYGRSKLAGEQAVAQAGGSHWIFRTSWVYGVHGANFMKTILRLAKERDSLRVVADQSGAPTWARTIADTTVAALRSRIDTGRPFSDVSGLYHLCAGGATTWHGYASRIVAQAAKAGVEIKLSSDAIEPIPTEAYPLPAPRPRNSRLDTGKIRETFGLALPSWESDVDACLAEIVAAG